MLAAGQAQRELFVNEALARIDALLHAAIEGEASAPPIDPVPGECWLVQAPATDDWQGHEGALASWDGTQWTFCKPVDGMHVVDRSSGGRIAYVDGWRRAARPDLPSGGATVDAEARAAIAAIVDMLATLAIFPSD
ncbi:DUF2793 domain-containing protein [Qipengyuania sp. 6D47A]|uniref:DUF2793 domain-containing protein n=2 Tax=Qipengyuania qiaonensis TaxID=2867240 RepID=A0ABS7J2A3_9SPHN|nr:DUF2793 domain-containing protein [Qipengyuania qiaonensis]